MADQERKRTASSSLHPILNCRCWTSDDAKDETAVEIGSPRRRRNRTQTRRTRSNDAGSFVVGWTIAAIFIAVATNINTTAAAAFPTTVVHPFVARVQKSLPRARTDGFHTKKRTHSHNHNKRLYGFYMSSSLWWHGESASGGKAQPSPPLLRDNNNNNDAQQQQPKRSPTPVMPSPLFQDLALSQLELLASSLLWKEEDDNDDDRCCGTNRTSSTSSKIKSLAVYLPQENARTGQLEFLPAVVFPNPHTERIFIASDSDSGVAPEFLPTLTMLLPGFARATSLLPGYPMLLLQESNDAGVGFVEEVGVWGGGNGTALSVPLLAGTQTVGVLLVSPVLRRRRPGRQQQQRSTTTSTRSSSMWSEYDRQQVARAAKSLSLALSLDNERTAARIQNQHVRDALSDSLHQFKNPLQALRTYGKLLQRRMAVVDGPDTTGKKTTTTLELAEHLLAQSERLVERLKPVDAIVDSMLAMTPTRGDERPLLALKPVEAKALVPWKKARDPSPIVWHIRNDVTTEPLPLRRGEKIIPSTRTMLMPDEPATTRMRSTTRMETPSKVSSIFLNGSLKLEMSFVSDVLTPVFSVFRDIATERGIFFTVDDEFDDELPGVLVCRQALQEVVINLLDNAFIYSTPGPFDSAASSPSRNPHVRVRLFPNQYRGVHTTSTNVQPGVTILVEDNGPGIIEQDREKVFVRGYRSPLTSEIANGSGIGLDIAQSLSTAMGATLRVVDNRSYANSLSGAIVEFVLFRKPQIPM